MKKKVISNPILFEKRVIESIAGGWVALGTSTTGQPQGFAPTGKLIKGDILVKHLL